MLKSMTGYSRYEYTEGDVTIAIEMKSVNSRYLEMNVKLPRFLNAFELNIKNEIKNRIKRGRVDVFVSYECCDSAFQKVKYDPVLAKEYFAAIDKIREDFPDGFADKISLDTFVRLDGIIKMEGMEQDEDKILSMIIKATNGAIDAFDEDRIREGSNLYDDIKVKLATIEEHLDKIIERAPENVRMYRENLTRKLQEVIEKSGLDKNRIATEAVIFADKICVDEETVRLKSHIEAVRKEIDKNESVGKKLDFLAQEMNREANTILSKSLDLVTTDHGVEIKTTIEKIREQIQNVE